jgi:hypothetical protein
LGFGVLKLLITLNSFDWLRVHLVPNSINMVHHHLANVCHPIIVGNNLVEWVINAKFKFWKTCVIP